MTTTKASIDALEEQVDVLIANALRLKGERDTLQTRLAEAERLLKAVLDQWVGEPPTPRNWKLAQDARAFLKGGTNG